MKEYKTLLTSFIEVVTFLFASFGGFLKTIAPPDQVGASYPLGITSFLMLIALMLISAIARRKSSKAAFKRWMSAGIVLFVFALPAAFLYPRWISQYTYPQGSQLTKRRISATDEYLTSDARQYKTANPNATPEELDRNLPDGDIWTRPGLEQSELKLLVAYGCLVLSLSGAIFCLLEANILATGQATKRAATAAKPQ